MDYDNKIDKIIDVVHDLKIQVAKQDLNLDRLNEILARLTDSVEIHVQRSDNLEELLSLYKKELDSKFQSEIEPLKSHVSFVKGITYAVSMFIGLLMILHQFGLLKF